MESVALWNLLERLSNEDRRDGSRRHTATVRIDTGNRRAVRRIHGMALFNLSDDPAQTASSRLTKNDARTSSGSTATALCAAQIQRRSAALCGSPKCPAV